MASTENGGTAGNDEGWGNAPSDSWDKSADDSWGTAAADATAVANTQDKSNTATDTCKTTEAPAVEASVAAAPYAPSKLVFKTIRCVIIANHPQGQPDSLGSLNADDNPDNWALCSLYMGVLNENREVSLFLRALFPKIPSTNDPSGDKSHLMGLNFYGDAFQNLDNDFVITPVNDFHTMLGPLKNHKTAFRLLGTALYKLQLIYQPEKVVTKGKDDPLASVPRSCSWPANAFRGLVRHGDPKTLNLSFRAQDRELEALHALKERLRVEKDIRPFEEQRRDKRCGMGACAESVFGDGVGYLS